MLKSLFFIVLAFLATTASGQIITAKVYDSTGVVKGIKVYNKTQNSLTATDDLGLFTLPAKVGDTLAFESLFHHPMIEVLKPFHFKEVTVFEVKKIVNTLDAVEILSESKQPEFVEETYNLQLRQLIQNDIKNNPEKYRPGGPSYGVDFIAIFGMVAKLFKKKDKYKPTIYPPLSYKQIDSLFSKSSFFSERLLKENLNIPEQHSKLFLEFCAAKQISSELLADEKKMQLLEELVLNSQLFLIILEEYGKEKTSKE